MLNLRTALTVLAPATIALIGWTSLSALADTVQTHQSSVPTDGGAVQSTVIDEEPPTYSEMGWTVGGEAASNTFGGTSYATVLNLFSFRKASIGSDKPAYPTHAVELDASLVTGHSLANDKFLVGGVVRTRAFIGKTALKRHARTCSHYFGLNGQADGSIYSNRRGESQLIVNVGPEGGIMCQLDDVMLQLGPTLTVGTTLAGNDWDASDSVDTGSNAIGFGGRARLLVGDRLYFSADTTVHPKISVSKWSSRTGSLTAQLIANGWVFMGTVKRIEMEDSSGTSPQLKGNEGSVSVGHAW